MDYLITGPADAKHTFVFAHGAGGAMDTPFMNDVAAGLAERGIRVVRFEFPYMAARRAGKKKGGAPDRQPVLLETWTRVVEAHGGGPKLVIGGKSMGGRMASMIADAVRAKGLVCMGYPFHPPGKPERLRTEHLKDLRTPALIIQGTRDTFGGPEEVSGYELSPRIRVEWIEGGDHSLFKTRQKDAARYERVIDLCARFVLRPEA